MEDGQALMAKSGSKSWKELVEDMDLQGILDFTPSSPTEQVLKDTAGVLVSKNLIDKFISTLPNTLDDSVAWTLAQKFWSEGSMQKFALGVSSGAAIPNTKERRVIWENDWRDETIFSVSMPSDRCAYGILIRNNGNVHTLKNAKVIHVPTNTILGEPKELYIKKPNPAGIHEVSDVKELLNTIFGE